MGKSGKKVITTVIALCFILSTVLCSLTVYADDTSKQVSLNSDTGVSLSNANTTRKLAVASDGTIYVTYHCTAGIRVLKSTDNGQTFQTSSIIAYNKNYEAEIAVSTDGTVYLVWVENHFIMLSKSTDKAEHFSAPKAVGPCSGTAHMATDGNYIYIIQQEGQTLYRSIDSGSNFTGVSLGASSYVFSDVHVDAASHKVIVQEDNPNIKYYISSNYGATFGAAVTPAGAAVYFSVGSLALDSTGLYLIVAGYGSNGVKINTDTISGAFTTPSMGNNVSSYGRSLSSDAYGNVITGYSDGSNVYLMVSHDLGTTFGSPITVAAANQSSAAINTTNGDVLFLYAGFDGKIYLNTYSKLLNGYGLNISNSNLYFNANNGEFTKDVSVKNITTSALTINSITTTGDFSIDRSAIGSTMSAGQESVIHVTFNPTAAGTRTGKIVINYGSPAQEKVINLTGYLLDQVPQITIQPQSKTVDENQSTTLSVSASGQFLKYQWYKDGKAISGATSNTYTMGKAQASDAGSYKAVVSNLSGSVSSDSANVTVNAVNIASQETPKANIATTSTPQVAAAKTGDYAPIFLMAVISIGSGTFIYMIYRYKKRSFGF